MLEHSNVLMPLDASCQTEDAMGLMQGSARLATYLDSITLPFRKRQPNKGNARKLLMTDWCSVLSPRRDMRVVSSEMYIASSQNASQNASQNIEKIVLHPIIPAVDVESLTRWSRMLVGRGVSDESKWPNETRAEHFVFNEMKLPHSYPLGIFPTPPALAQDGYVPTRTGRTLVSAGTSSSLYSWLSSLSDPLRNRSAEQETARRYANLSEEDAVSIAEDLNSLADSYSSSS